MKSTNKSKSVYGVLWMTFLNLSSIPIKLLTTMVLSRVLLPDQFGEVAAVQVVISFADMFWMMGVSPAIVQKKDLTIDDVNTGNLLNIIFGFLVYATVFASSPLISSFVGINDVRMLQVLSLIFIIHSIFGVPEALLQKNMKFKSIGLINLVSLFLYGLSATTLAVLGFGAWSLIFAQLLQVIITMILILSIEPVKLSLNVNINSAKHLLNYGTGHTLAKLINNFANQGDYFVVSRTLGSSSLGFYNRSYQLLLFPTSIISNVLSKVLFSLLSKYQDDHKKIEYIFLNITSLIALSALPITIVSIISGADLVHLVLGPNWNQTVIPFQILMVSLVFRMGYKICDSIVKSLGAVYERIWVQSLYAMFIVVGAFIGKEWGINGVAVSTSIAIFLNYIFMTLLIKKIIRLKIRSLLIYTSPIFKISILIALISFFINLLLEDFSNGFIRLVIMTLNITIMYFVSYKFYLQSHMPVEFIDFIETIKSLILNPIRR